MRNSKKLSFLFLAGLIASAGWMFQTSVKSQERTVTEVKAIAKPKEYRGPCPASIEFVATIFVSHHPVRVTYQWERSDGAKGPRETVDIRSAGQGVYTTWQIGRPRGVFDGWERLHVLAPTGITSNDAVFHVRCD